MGASRFFFRRRRKARGYGPLPQSQFFLTTSHRVCRFRSSPSDGKLWLMNMSLDSGHAALRKARASAFGQIYHVTLCTYAREPFFADPAAAAAAARCHIDAKYLGLSTLLAWVLMPDHAHWLLQLGEGDALPLFVTRLKCSSGRSANKVLGRSGRLWQRAYHDHALRRDEDVVATARYIVNNPLRAGLVQSLGQYPFWNAIWI